MAEFREPVGGMGVKEVRERINVAMNVLEQQFPGLGITLMIFDFTPREVPSGELTAGGFAYISNANRQQMRGACFEWLNRTAEPEKPRE